jgi:cytochrome b
MNESRSEAAPGSAAGRDGDLPVTVRVWDLPVRVFHWTLLVLVVFSVATAYVGGSWMDWHMRSGYAVLALLAFRIAWGFAGTRHARFASFVRRPAAVVDYLKQLRSGAHPVSVGHNPLGALSVLALIAVVGVQVGTGLFANDDIFTEGPLAKLVSKSASDQATTVHYWNQWALYALVAMHVLAVLVHRLRFGDNLVGPMIAGTKALPARFAQQDAGPTPVGRALVVAALATALAWYVTTRV